MFYGIRIGSLGIPGYGGTSGPSNAAPVIDLNGASGGINASGTFTEGDGATTFIASATVTDADDTDLASITIVGTNGFGENVANDIVSWGAVTFPSNADKTANVVAGATTIQVAFTTATKTFVCTKSGGGEIPKADAQTFVRAFAYNNTATPPDTSDRVFTFTVNDGTTNSSTATLMVTVEAAGSEAIDTDNELMSLISLNRPYIVLLDPTSVSSDSATRLMAHVYAGDE